MKSFTVLADGVITPSGAPTGSEILHLNTLGRDANVRRGASVFRTQFGQEIPRHLDDLMTVASFVYMADRSIPRGTERDVFGTKWPRHLYMAIPVWEPGVWSNAQVASGLEQTLRVLTGDEWQFDFSQRTEGKQFQELLKFEEPLYPLPQVDVVNLFSGGADSLAAVLEAVDDGRRPILVSHRSAPVLDTRQRNLLHLLRERRQHWPFPHISMWVNRKGGQRTPEESQRSRSFLYASLGIVTAAMLGIDEVRLCDNGVVSINLPQSGQSYGTTLTRSTHPQYLQLLQDFARSLTNRPSLTIVNTLLFKTRREVFESIAASGHPELLQEAISCAHVEGKTAMQPHCGVCSQCIDRRVAAVAAGLEDYDLAERYEKDIFTHALNEGLERTHVENYVRFAQTLEKLPHPDAFFEKYPELFDLPLEDDADWERIWLLFQRHQRTVNGVIETVIQRHAAEIRRGSIPSSSMIGMINHQEHVRDECDRVALRLRDLLCSALRPAFQTQEATDERHMQDVGEAVLQGALLSLRREAPQLPFAAVTTKPDFSDSGSNGSPPLFVEFKYVRRRDRLNGVLKEITSRILIYRQQGASVLFIVYDPAGAITNVPEFIADLQCHKNVWVGVAR